MKTPEYERLLERGFCVVCQMKPIATSPREKEAPGVLCFDCAGTVPRGGDGGPLKWREFAAWAATEAHHLAYERGYAEAAETARRDSLRRADVAGMLRAALDVVERKT